MKTNTLVFLGILFFTFGCSNQKVKNDLVKDGLFGKVKSIKDVRFEAADKFGEITKNGKGDGGYCKIYNENGNLIERKSRDSDGSFKTRSIYKYNDKGNLIEEGNYNPKKQLVSKDIYKYDENGKIIESYTDNLNGIIDYMTKRKCDDKGNLVENNSYNSDGCLTYKRIYKYDQMGNRIETTIYPTNGDDISKTSSNYDDKGNEIESNMYHPDGSIFSKTTYKYDIKGNIIEENDSLSLQIGTLKDKKIYKYDFDKKGNWIKKIEFRKELPVEITEREIVYFE